MKLYGKILFLFVLFCLACAQPPLSPTETLKEYVEAVKNKDVDGIKRTASKKSVQLVEEMIEPGTTLEETVKKNEPVLPPFLRNVETRNEKINGERATVEVRNQVNDTWIEVLFVLEDGRWKGAFAEMMDETLDDFRKKTDLLEKSTENYDKK